jgi:NAD(P)-dependent dehydrogenase (short-subunit alcohol dehydrogenase family)
MTTYLVTGATGFLGRQVVRRLLEAKDAEVFAVVRDQSRSRLAALTEEWTGGERVIPLSGDLAEPLLGLDPAVIDQLRGRVDHVIHLAALYDLTADAASTYQSNVEGTRHVLDLAAELGAGRVHQVSSAAVAGRFQGRYTEEMFDLGQELPSPYRASKFAAEKLVREQTATPWRIYRPAVIVGDSTTGETDKIDGPYYFFSLFRRLRALPSRLRLAGPDLGSTNIVPVDYVATAMVHLIHAHGLDGRTFHLGARTSQSLADVYNAFAAAAGLPLVIAGPGRVVRKAAAPVARLGRLPGVALTRDFVLDPLGIPPQILPHLTFPFTFDSSETRRILAGAGIVVPELADYAPLLWRYWRRNLDPDRFRRGHPDGPLVGRRVVITGASSGIGRAVALKVAAEGGIPILVARSTDKLEQVKTEIEAGHGVAYLYPCDLTQAESVDALIKRLLAEHEGIDMLVNNAGRSIRRSIKLSYDRFHDYERTMALNYFGAVRLILAVLPHMAERRFGHIVNISSIGVQANTPRFSAYVASKAALDAFTRVAASEVYGDGITFTTIHMPLVRTPMIAPTRMYDAFPIKQTMLMPEQAADLVMKALTKRPKDISTPLGTAGEVLYALAPKAVDAVLHVAYRVFPDSAAARGVTEPNKDISVPEPRLAPDAVAMVRLLPGVHW